MLKLFLDFYQDYIKNKKNNIDIHRCHLWFHHWLLSSKNSQHQRTTEVGRSGDRLVQHPWSKQEQLEQVAQDLAHPGLWRQQKRIQRVCAAQQALLVQRLHTDADVTHAKPEAENTESAVQRNLILLTNTFNYIQSFISLPLNTQWAWHLFTVQLYSSYTIFLLDSQNLLWRKIL